MNMEDNIAKIVGARLRQARRASGFRSASAFSSANNIPTTTYNNHENGFREVNATLILKYCRLLEISPHWLLTGEGEMLWRQLPPENSVAA